MRFNRWCLLALVLSCFTASLALAQAATDAEATQEEGWTGETGEATPEPAPPVEGAPEDEVPEAVTMVPYARRNMTLNKGQLRIDLAPPDFALRNFGQGLTFGKVDGVDDMFVSLHAGAAFGVMDNLELGAVVLPLNFAPSGVDTYGNPTVYGRYKFWGNDEAQIGFQADVYIPAMSGSKFAFAVGVPMQFRFGDNLRMDTGARVRLDMFDDPQGTTPTLDLPLALNYNIQPNIFIGGTTGIRMFDFKTENGQMSVPLFLQGGYTLDNGMADIIAYFGWPRFFVPDPIPGGDKIESKTWQLGIGANLYFQVM